MIRVLIYSLVTCQSENLGFEINQNKIGTQLFQWPFKSIEKECVEYLAPNGYAWLQTSPINAHPKDAFDGFVFPWYLAYQPLSYRIGNRLGSEQDFIDMVTTCKSVGVDVVVDVVLNHNAFIDKADDGGFNVNQPWTTKNLAQNLPDLGFNASHYNDATCNGDIVNWDNEFERYNCRILTLSDIKTSDAFVRTTMANFLNRLIDIGVIGFRTDLAVCIPANDWRAIFSQVKNNYRGNRPFLGQEAYDFSSPQGRNYRSYPSLGRIYNVDYSRAVGRSFTNFETNTLDQLPQLLSGLQLREDQSAVFIENHDKERNEEGEVFFPLSRRNNAWWYRQAIAFNILYPYGYSIVHSGYRFTWRGGESVLREDPISAPYNETGYILPVTMDKGVCQGAWLCQHRWSDVAPLVKVRNFIGDVQPTINTNGRTSNQIWWSIPSKALIAINSAQGTQVIQDMTNVVASGLAPGTYCNQVYAIAVGDECQLLPGVVVDQEQIRYVVGGDGRLQLNIRRQDRSRVVVLYAGPQGKTTTGGVSPTVPTTTPTRFEIVHDAGQGNSVFVVGTFNNWNTCAAVPCQFNPGNRWTCGPVELESGKMYRWKAIKLGSSSSTVCESPVWQGGSDQGVSGGASLAATSF
jgi:alpha-amylase